MMKKIFFSAAIMLIFGAIFGMLPAQTKITVEDLYLKGTFTQRGVYGLRSMNDGEHYTKLGLSYKSIEKYSYETGNSVATLFKASDFKDAQLDYIVDYEFSADESKLLLCVQYEPIYRHSYKAEYYVYDLAAKTLTRLSTGGKQQAASFSPDGTKVAFVRENNIFVKGLTPPDTTERQLTNDGQLNAVINGVPDWVYEEEFSYSKAYDWSADGSKIAFLRTDESNVKMFNFPVYGELYPTNYDYKYPKAGEENSKVSLHIVDLASNAIVKADMGDLNDMYIPRLQFTKTPGLLAAVKLNRLQNKYELYLIDANTGGSHVVLTLNDDKYLEINDDLTFLNDGKHFVTSHEQDGFRHLYLYDLNGNLVHQLTTGKWEVTALYGVDETTQTAYFQAAKASPLDRGVYSVDLEGKKIKPLANKAGTSEADFSTSYKYFICTWSDANSPIITTLHNSKGKKIRDLEVNKSVADKMREYGFAKKEFFTLPADDGTELNAWIIKPADFDASKSYPVLMFVYGGPGSQTVANAWDHDMPWWQLLSQQGYVIVSVDNRGTGFRGRDFRQITYRELGKIEVNDQIAAAKYLGKLPYIDKKRIGIFGWSYGGYMSTLCMTVGAEYFKLGIAVAPVTNWRYYDSIYTERYNGLPQDNADGYDKNSPINHVKKMKGHFLLIHGTADDNVHFQNSVDLVSNLVDANVDFETMYYPNKNHGIYGGNTRNHLYREMTNFILNNL